jgi:peptidoglycan/LPS O-acetylase OafA/YrhL
MQKALQAKESFNGLPINQEWAVLAALRFVLASIVCFGHIGIVTKVGPEFSWVYSSYTSGHAAVLGFFVVSGYSIAASIGKRPNGFLVRRVVRLLPMYWVGLVISTIPILLSGALFITTAGVEMKSPSIFQWLGNALLMQGFFVSMFYTFGQAWSLSIEFFYYALAKIINKISLLFILLISVISGIIYTQVLPKLENIHDALWGITALGLFWAWLMGFCFRKYESNFAINGLLLVFGVSYLLIFDLTTPFYYSWKLFLIVSLLVLLAKYVPIPKSIVPSLSFLGEISYPLYILHFGVFCALNKLGIENPYALIVSCYLISAIAHIFIEIPIHKYARQQLRANLVPQS